MLMLLTVHVTSVLFLVRFNNFAPTMSYTLLLKLPVLMAGSNSFRTLLAGVVEHKLFP